MALLNSNCISEPTCAKSPVGRGVGNVHLHEVFGHGQPEDGDVLLEVEAAQVEVAPGVPGRNQPLLLVFPAAIFFCC